MLSFSYVMHQTAIAYNLPHSTAKGKERRVFFTPSKKPGVKH